MKRKYIVSLLFLVLLAAAIAPVSYAAEAKINLRAVLSKGMPVLFEFGRGWCIPCKYMKPILKDMAKTYAGKAIVMPVDMDANRTLVRDFRIRMMPTQVFLLPNGKEFFRNEGTLEREQIVQLFAKMGVPSQAQSAATRPAPQGMPAQAPPIRQGASR